MNAGVTRVYVWPRVLRLIHWVMALSVLLLLATGWLLQSGLVLNEQLHQLLLEGLHLPAGHLLGVALLIRTYLLLRENGVGGWGALLPKGPAWTGIKTGLRFYASFARTPMPRYYAHHPVWAPLYLVWLALLWLQSGTGLALEFGAVRSLFGLSSQRLLDWHLAPFTLLAVLVGLHILSVVLHELKGQGSDVSGMINGHRTFATADARSAGGLSAPPAVSLQDLEGWVPPKRSDKD